MATKQGGSSRPTDKQRSTSLFNFSRNLSDSWIGRNWQTALLIVMLVFLALFVRSYFGYSTSVENGFLLSGGSDSYYHQRVIDHVVSTGDHLLFDEMLNYPNGMMNPRPPLYDWSVAVFGMFASAVTGAAIADAVGMSLVFSTAIWGALTVIPVYMLGKAAFGKKAGILGGFIFAIMAGHIERSVLSNADHDAIVLFFVVFAFYFLLRSLQTVSGSNWVSSWKDRKTIPVGIKKYFGTNQVSLIYAALGGLCVAAVGLIWTGFPYIMIIVLVYFLVQLLVDRFRNSDSMGVLFSILVFLGVAFMLMAPVYTMMGIWKTWFDIPLFLFVGGVVLGLMFVVTRDYPWTLVLPVFTVLALATLALLSVFSPAFFESIISGQGYLVKSKLYDTISEAQAPGFSSLAMSFGMVTFWLALIGVGWAVYKIPKNVSPYFIFVVVWVGVSIYMASSAARFVFNASPAFAVSAGWVLGMIISHLKFDEMVRNMRSDHGGMVKMIRHSVKLRHIIGALFVVMMILVPNTWYALDAGIPTDTKQDYDRQIYLAMPGFMRPGDYDVENGTYWYLGAFSYGMSLPDEYWPSAWKWFSMQDTETPSPVNRPAFLSWWDYGFEAMQEGDHPSVADNFQNGYQFAGSFLMTQTEEGAIALLIVRCVEKDITDSSNPAYAGILSSMETYGVDVAKIKDIMTSPASYVKMVLDNPEIYGYYESDLSAGNAKYAAAKAELSKLDKGQLVSLYNEVRSITGNDIGYISVDSRLFPFSATSYNIFYAPAKLSDQRVDENTNTPYDYYQIYAIDSYGLQIPLDEVTSSDQIVDYEIVYTEAFYDTMLYRVFMGYGPSDVGATEQGIPGVSGSLSNLPSMQAWNMSNFRMVYRTAYYNPYPSTEVANHSDSWRAISYDEGIELYGKISTGEVIGTIDLSSSSLYQGVVFLQYYDGAIIEGTAVSDSGRPMANLWVTVLDEYGIPHQTVQTDADGHYSLIAPFGDVTVVFSYGDLDLRLQVGTELYSTTLNITYDQAMRVPDDVNKDGQLDYMIDLDVIITGGSIEGQVYLDLDENGKFSTADEALIGATVVFENGTSGYRAEVVSTADGYEIIGVSPMNGTMWVEYQGHVFGEKEVSVKIGTPIVADFAYTPASVTGSVLLEDGNAANGVEISLLDQTSGTVIETTTDASGAYSFQGLLPGNYTIQTPDGTVLENSELLLSEGDARNLDLVLYQSMRISGLVSYDGNAVSNAMIGLSGDYGVVWVRSDSRGRYSVVMPKGNVSVYATATVNGQEVVYLSKVLATDSMVLNLQTGEAVILEGNVQSGGSGAPGATIRMESRTTGAVFNAVTNTDGGFRAVLPADLYFVYMYDESRSYWEDIYLDASVSSTFNMLSSVKMTGTAWYDANGDGVISSGERLSGVLVSIADQDGRKVTVATDSTGQYTFGLVAGRSYTLTAIKAGYDLLSKNFASFDTSVTSDLKMLATERQVSGRISMAISGVIVSFTADSGSASSRTAETTADGSFSLSLVPGDYLIKVDQNVIPGNTSVKYQSLESMELTIDIGHDPTSLEVEVVERVLVTGTVSPSGTVTMVFDGPERTAVSAVTTYSVYLQEGDYSLYVKVDNSTQHSADLSSVTISGPTTLDVAAATADQVVLRANLDGAVTSNVNISIMSGGAYYNVTSSAAGLATVYLSPGTYTASVDHRTVAKVDLVDRYVRYTGETSFTMASSLMNVAILTTRTLDNATIMGQVLSSETLISSSIQFQALSETAMDLSVDAPFGDYSVQLAPGNYSVYALSMDNTKAFLGTLMIAEPGTFEYDVELVGSLRLSGVTFANDVGVDSKMTVTGNEVYSFNSNADGIYEVYLPPRTYLLSAETQLLESGVLVTYTGYENVTLTEVTSKGIVMDKQLSYAVEVTWDTNQKATLSAGETAIYTIRLVNLGNVADTFKLTATGTGWAVVFSQSEISLDYGTGASQLVTVEVTPSSTIMVTHTAVIVKATSISNSSATSSVSLDADILPFRSVGLEYVGALQTDGSDYLFEVPLSNLGNIEDTYTVTIGDQEALRDLGWEVKLVNGTALSDSLSLTVAASDRVDVRVSLVPIRENPSPTVSVQIVAVSENDAAVQTTLDMTPEFVGLGTGGLSITGDGISDSTPKIGDDTIILLGVTLALMAVLLVLSIQKGVLSRRKR
ncbi:MAG TPA: carboxypeptidase regulatory-like domain-containing protein [Methanomassiliicoccales archaeon]|nr:carboxypeptidase regulatory-like domain-containing protein [Methanomassiliicoccales archaeon]